jgi:hypothetical protein
MDHAEDGGGDNGDVFIYMGGDQFVPEDVTHVRVHKSVKTIRHGAFQQCRKLVSIEMHDGVKIIKGCAFRFCTSLKGIKLAGVRIIEEAAFCNCWSLESVEFGNKLETIVGSAFLRCTSLKNIKISKVRVIESGAFSACHLLTDVQLSKELQRIGYGAFCNCPRLRLVTIPLKANLVVDHVFRGCDSLSQVDLIGGIHKTISSLLLDSWREEMNDLINEINHLLPNTTTDEKTRAVRQWMERVIRRMEHYKSEHYSLLKEFTTLLELALWKANLDDNVVNDAAAEKGVRVTRGQRKRARKDRCITSGASIVIKNVLPFLNDNDVFPLLGYDQAILRATRGGEGGGD